jgi:hypothetical protein
MSCLMHLSLAASEPGLFGHQKHPLVQLAAESRYTDAVPKRITISLDPAILQWACKEAAGKRVSVSKLIGRLLEKEMRASDVYWRAYEEWKGLPHDLRVQIDASKRFTRDEAHERR